MSGNSKKRLLKELRNKDARHVFVEEHARTGPAYQIKAMRDARDWSQEKLGQELGGEPQSTISRWENPDYGRFTIGTLLRVADAFDVALMVRFVSFGELVGRYSNLTPDALNAPSFESDAVIFDMTYVEYFTGRGQPVQHEITDEPIVRISLASTLTQAPSQLFDDAVGTRLPVTTYDVATAGTS